MNTRVRFLGSKQQGLSALRALAATGVPLEVITIDDRADARSVLVELQSFCAQHAIPCTVVRNRREASFAMQATAVSLGVVVGWYWLLSAADRATAMLGYVGVHNSLLPTYRGGSPLVWALIDGVPTVGASLFTIGDDVDDGGIWGQTSCAVAVTDRIGDVLDRLTPAATQMIADSVPRILCGDARAVTQEENDATWCAQRIPDDGVIDWRWSATRVHNFIRAQSEPYPGAFTYLQQQRLHVWRSRIESAKWRATPGQIVSIRGSSISVACGDDSVLAIDEASLGSARQEASAIIRTRNVRFPAVPLLLDALPTTTALREVAA